MRKSFTAATSAQSAQDSESKVGVSTVSPCNQAAEQMVLGTELTCRMVLSDKENRSECEPEENLQLPRRPVNRDARRDANERCDYAYLTDILFIRF